MGDSPILQLVAAVRALQSWDTIPVTLTDVSIDAQYDNFRINLQPVTTGCYRLYLGGQHPGRHGRHPVRFKMIGEVLSAFRRNRIGFCVLHPSALAGHSYTVEQTGGGLVQSAFPDFISPHQPFYTVAISHSVAPGVDATRAHGGRHPFEMEDPRNWT